MILKQQVHTVLVNAFNKAYYAAVFPFHLRARKHFRSYYIRFRELYGSFNATGENPFIVPFWESKVDEMGNIFLTTFNDSFLEHEVIRKTMFLTYKPSLRKEQLNFLKSRYSEKELAYLLKESVIGRPLLESVTYRTSHNSIHHLCHLTTFSNRTNIDLRKVKRVIEWGGGYGNMARLMKNISPSCTYIIIDLPVFSMIQASYLSTVLGEGSVKVITSPGEPLRENAVNLVPLTSEDMLSNPSLIGNGLFISTWALTESSEYALHFVQEKRYFDSDYLLMAHVDSNGKISEATNTIMSNLSNYTVVAHEPISRLAGNFYLFCKRP